MQTIHISTGQKDKCCQREKVCHGFSESLETHDYSPRKHHKEICTLKTRFPEPSTIASSTKTSGFVHSSPGCALVYMQSIIYHAGNLNTGQPSDSRPLFFCPFVYPVSCHHSSIAPRLFFSSC